MSRLKPAICSALLVLVLAFPVLGLKLQTVGIQLQVTGASPATLWGIGGAALLVFIAQLLRPQIAALRQQVGWTSSACPPNNPLLRLSRPQLQKYTLLALIGVALVWPFFGSRGAVDLATLVLIYVMLGLGLNIVVGLAGLLDLGYVGFYAVGAYTYAMLSQYQDLGFWACLPLAGLFAALFGFALGFPVLRLRGDYLAIVTLGFGEIIRILLRNLTEWTGGPNGISGLDKPTLFGLSFERRLAEGEVSFHQFFGLPYNAQDKVTFLYLIALLLVLLTLLVINRLLRMPLGRAWEALREDEIACRSLGLDPTRIKLSAFTLGAAFAGFAGCFFAARQGLVSPESFTFIESAIILAIVVLGGMGSQLGIILAASLLILLPEVARSFNEYRMLLFGALMVLMMIWRPQGLLPMQRPHLEVGR